MRLVPPGTLKLKQGLELLVGLSVGWLVITLFDNHSNNFLDFWHKLGEDKSRKGTEPKVSGKFVYLWLPWIGPFWTQEDSKTGLKTSTNQKIELPDVSVMVGGQTSRKFRESWSLNYESLSLIVFPTPNGPNLKVNKLKSNWTENFQVGRYRSGSTLLYIYTKMNGLGQARLIFSFA